MAREVGKGRYKKAKSAREVSISDTAWKEKVAGAKGQAGRLVGPGGKLFTGTVKMQDGSKVVYEKGKRVSRRMTEGGGVTKAQAASSRNAQPGRSTTTAKPTEKKPATTTQKPASGQNKPKPKAKTAGPATGTYTKSYSKTNAGSGSKPTSTTERPKYKRNPVGDRPRPQGRNLTKQDIALDRARREGPQGPLAQVVRRGVQALTSRGAAKEGATRVSGGGRYKQTYKNGKWVTTHTKSTSGRWVKKS